MTKPPFGAILVANRGEIAVRVIRACREMGIHSVAVYSDVDAGALHVRMADEAHPIGPAPALESYLRGETLVDVALKTGAQAVHPGYGFLAESPEFARLVLEAGLSWIGPPPEVIALLGNKLAAKRLALTASVPVVPGYDAENASPEQFAMEAERVGYPVMIKAAAGGGGKGMRIVSAPGDLITALEAAAREASSAFGDNRVFLEKALVRPRHIEIQILADAHGNMVHLGERDCTVQRRHQKVLEESPSPVITPELRHAMGEAALRIARAAGYVNAGTVEFLFAADSFYFLEVNTRIQVEHPVTEVVTGLDLVRLQIQIASGDALPLDQMDVRMRGHAVEARLYAEDASAGFLPATGTITVFSPPAGPGIRNDVGVEVGSAVTPHYDPILAKLVAHAETRDEAVTRLRTALEDYGVLGATTNQAFLHWVTTADDFVVGHIDTGFVDQHWDPGDQPSLPDEVLLLAAAWNLAAPPSGGGSSRNPWHNTGGWRTTGVSRHFDYVWNGEDVVLAANRSLDGTWSVRTGDRAHDGVTAVPAAAGRVTAILAGAVVSGFVVEAGSGLDISWRGITYRLERPAPGSESSHGSAGGERESLMAPMPGTITRVLVQSGDAVTAHQPLVIMEAMKMEHVIEAPRAGVVRDVLFAQGDLVPAGSALIRLEDA